MTGSTSRAAQRLLTAVLDQQERLSRLLENMLTAARRDAVDPTAVAEVDAVAAEVAMLAGAPRARGRPSRSSSSPGTVARIDRHALHQVLANLVDNAQQHGNQRHRRRSSPAARDEQRCLGHGQQRGPDARRRHRGPAVRAVHPGRHRRDAATREGLGMGLYVVRRLVEVYGGTVDVRSENGWVTVELRLQPGATALPTARSGAGRPTRRGADRLPDEVRDAGGEPAEQRAGGAPL